MASLLGHALEAKNGETADVVVCFNVKKDQIGHDGHVLNHVHDFELN